MTVETFFANFGHLADAPNGVQKLRELILQLAVQGKLVPQDPNDEPASVLLGKINKERARLLKLGQIRKTRLAQPVGLKDVNGEALQGWIWIKLAELGELYGGGTPSKNDSSFWGGTIPWVTPKDMKSDVVTDAEDKITEEAIGKSAAKLIPPSSLLIVGRSGILKRTLPVCINAMECTVNQDLKVLVPYLTEITRYLQILMKGFEYFILTKFVKGGMTVQSLVYDELFSYPFPLPPLEEQKRIVAKVDQLMALCDELEVRQQKQQQGRVRLNNAALAALLTAREPDEFADQWQRISTNFDLLYDHPETIVKLRAAILQLAVQGKLIPQDPNDEPASVLLERIKAEKERLVKGLKGRNPKPSSPITDDQLPFSLPNGWSCLRLEDFGVFLGGGTPSKQKSAYWEGDIPWVSPKDMKVQYLADSIDHVSEEAIENSSTKLIPEGALLMVVRGMILLHSFPVAKTTRDVTVNQDMKALICSLPDVAEYLLKVLIAEKGRVLDLVERSSHGTCRLDTDSLCDLVIALPPFEEQTRIVAKVDQLMTLCDELETKLNQAQQHSVKLMEATVRQLLVE